MMRRFLCDTSLEGYRALSVGRHLVYDSWDQVYAFLHGTLGEAHAALFAEPHVGSGAVAWMTTTASDPVAMSTLAPEAREAALARLKVLMDEIAAAADAKGASIRMEDQRWAALLKAILTVPASRDLADILYVANGEPVLVQWGTRDENSTTSYGTLREKIIAAMAQGTPAIPPAAAADGSAPLPQGVAVAGVPGGVVVERSPAGWLAALLLWLLFVALLAWIYWHLVVACAVSLPFGGRLGFCAPAAAPEAAANDRRGELLRDLGLLQRQLAQTPQCNVQTAELPPPAPPAQQETDLDRAREQAGGQTGDITITLLWNGHADLDLMISCPGGDKLAAFQTPRCGGEVDVDANWCSRRGPLGCETYHGDIVDKPIENAFFIESAAEHGTYHVEVRNFAGDPQNPGADVPFALQIRRGDNVKMLNGSAGDAETVGMADFTIE